MSHSESEIRGMLEARRKEVEAIAIRCAKAQYTSTVHALGEALKWIQEAKLRVAGEEAQE